MAEKRKGTRSRRYAGRILPRTEGDLTWRDRDFRAKALQREQEIRVRRGELVEQSEVEAGHAEMREVLRSDLLGVLPTRLAEELSNKPGMTPQQVREAVLRQVRDMLAVWSKAGMPAQNGGKA